MKQAVIDTNFILACVKKKIDFFEEIRMLGYRIIIPKQIVREIEKIKNSNQKEKEKHAAKVSLLILKRNHFDEIDLPGSYVDAAIKNFTKKNPDAAVATLDDELKKSIQNPKILIRGKKLEVAG